MFRFTSTILRKFNSLKLLIPNYFTSCFHKIHVNARKHYVPEQKNILKHKKTGNREKSGFS